MTFASTGFGYVLYLEPGDELIRCLIHFARSHEVDEAVLQGAGTVAEVELGADTDTGQARRRLAEPLEACSVTGTLTRIDGEPFPSIHGSFARADCSVLGGRVFQAVCRTRLEVALQVADAPLALDDAAGGAADIASPGSTTTDGTDK